jgi:Sulfotransferase domain
MALKVIGAGFGRTGTLSLKYALQRLGFGPCYHMMEVFSRHDHIKRWYELTVHGGRDTDWDALFRDFQAAVDWPAARWWRELAAHYADAKVVLSVRDPDEWYASMRRTIYPEIMRPVEADAPEFAKRLNDAVRQMIVADTFDDRFEDRAFAVQAFKRHIDEVRDSIDESRLLVFDVRDGWAPLCELLGVPIPEEPFPYMNESGQFPAPQGDARGAAWPPPPGPVLRGHMPRPGPPPPHPDLAGPVHHA